MFSFHGFGPKYAFFSIFIKYMQSIEVTYIYLHKESIEKALPYNIFTANMKLIFFGRP
jgi:hypothetical protein